MTLKNNKNNKKRNGKISSFEVNFMDHSQRRKFYYYINPKKKESKIIFDYLGIMLHNRWLISRVLLHSEGKITRENYETQ